MKALCCLYTALLLLLWSIPIIGQVGSPDNRILNYGVNDRPMLKEGFSLPVKVFIMAGQSNMQGFGKVRSTGEFKGSLEDVVQNDSKGDWSALGHMDDWTIVDHAWHYFERDQGTIRNRVTVDQGAFRGSIGPELMFGHEMNEHFEETVLIIKTAWGGKSLAVDFRPPSAGGQTGEYYTRMIEIIERVTSNITTEFPQIEIDEFELVGFAWFQGWNDGESDEFLDEYESNLVHLINDVRQELKVPNLPFVIANSGQGGVNLSEDPWVYGLQTKLVPAQENVACNESYNGYVAYVDTQPYYYDASESPEDAVHHFNDHALTYLNIGKHIAVAMKEAMEGNAGCQKDEIPTGLISESEDHIRIYPNPAVNRVTIQSTDKIMHKIELLRIDGKVVNSWQNVSQNSIDIDIPDLNGVYLIKVSTFDKRFEYRILKVN